MPETGLPAGFHFLRPEWLWLLIVAVLVPVLASWRDRRAVPGAREIAPHLLAHLVVPRGRTRWFRPAHLGALVLTFGAIGMAGPTWQREPTPFAEDLAPLVIVLDLSRSMDAIDIAPTRLERAKQKIADLVALRSGARTALVVYAGTAHMVLPPTDDPTVMSLYLESLSTDLMPREGKDASAALAVAAGLLEKDEVPGSVLFITDGIGSEHLPAFAAFPATGNEVMLLGVGTSEGGPIRTGENRFLVENGRRVTARLDLESLRAVAREAGAYVGTVTVDDTDVQRLQRRIQTHLQAAREADTSARWLDAGYFLVYPAAFLVLLWFRRGWTINWAAVLLVALLWPLPAYAQGSDASPGFRFIDLWLTRDQQGRYYFDRGDYATAADRFVDPMWKGVACYRADDLDCAADQFARLDTADANYNLGNVYVRLRNWEEAVAAYDRALELRPGFADARENRDLVLDVIRRIEEAREKQQDEPPPQTDPTFAPDQVEFSDKGKEGTSGEIDRQMLQEAMAEKWLGALQTTPAEFLRMKFAIQAEGSSSGTGPGSGAPARQPGGGGR